MNLLRFRSDLLSAIRGYFNSEGVMEVVTPVLRKHGASEPHLQNIEVPGLGMLQTSPEYAMKILLARHGVSMYQICPAFRGGETGDLHRIEFQMLEWYRCDQTLEALMDDVVSLINVVAESLAPRHELALRRLNPERFSYRELFEQHFGVNPHGAETAALKRIAPRESVAHLDATAEPADFLDAMFSAAIEPSLPFEAIVYDYPLCQAALAESRLNAAGDQVSARFELFIDGMELANAYQELRDPDELRARFRENNLQRKKKQLPVIEDDELLLDSLASLPHCAGVAMGVDRLSMVLSGAASINDV